MADDRSSYAAKTQVSEEKSRAEIETLLRKYGASETLCASRDDAGMVAFRLNGRLVRVILPIPSEMELRFQRDGRGYLRTPRQRRQVWEQERRQRWRALLLAIKAKFVAIEAGITTVEEAFFANLVLPNNQTMAQWMEPQLAQVYERGELPQLLPGLPPARE